jgi:cytochrome c553
MKRLHVLLVALVMLPAAGQADEDEDKGGNSSGEQRGRTLLPAKVNATWAKECSTCHVAYPPGLLPAQSWRKLMTGLDKHFGSDASLTSKEIEDVSGFLVANASNRWASTNAPLRITEAQWFKSKHNAGEIPPAIWKRASVKSASNCLACHAQADKGDFNERSIKIPQ